MPEGISVGPEETVVISRRHYLELLHAKNMLSALQAAGVDNWDGYDDALSVYEDDSWYV